MPVALDNQTPCSNSWEVGLLSLQELLFGWKIGHLKKYEREVRHAKQDSDRPGVTAAPPASPTINWIARSHENFKRHPDAGDAVCGQ
jgi:hypothetical protein